MQRFWMIVTLTLLTAGSIAIGCGSTVQSGSTDNSGSSSSSNNAASTAAGGFGGIGGEGGTPNPTGMGGMGTGGNGAGGNGAGGSSAYQTCADCTSPKGARMNECAAELMACMEWKTCVSYLNCNDTGFAGGPGPCNHSTVADACCSISCENTLADPEGIARYRALDTCIHCQTCGSLCNTTTTYCSVFEPGGEMLCKP